MYTERSALKAVGTHAANSSLASAAVIESYAVIRQVKLSRIAIVVETAISSTGDVVVTFKKYPTHNSTSGAVSLGTISIPTGTAAGKVLYKNLSALPTLKPGEMLVAEVTTAASSAGKGCSLVDCEDSPEQPANNSNMVASA